MTLSGASSSWGSVLARVLDSYGSIVLAVSGGADSTALLHMAAEWATMDPRRRDTITVATVDHQLRAGSGAEAQQVAAMARELGLRHETLVWTGDKPQTGIQTAAREARYSLLAALAVALPQRPVAIVTAHTADDQAETLLMRLARGSGVDGLAAMPEVRPAFGGDDRVDLVRPLLSVTRADLLTYLRQRAVTWIDDPSNGDPRFERVRLRAAWPALEGTGLGVASLALSARRLQRARHALEEGTSRLAVDCLALHNGAYAVIDCASFAAAPEEYRVRLMCRVLAGFGGESPPATLAEVESLVTRLTSNPSLRVTLGGCAVRSCHREVRVFRETGRHGLPEAVLRPGEVLFWDRRFEVRFTADGGRAVPGPSGDSPLHVRALTPGEAAALRRRDGFRLPARALVTLPSFWRGNLLVAVGGTECADTAVTDSDRASLSSGLESGLEVRWLGRQAILSAAWPVGCREGAVN